MFNLKDAAVYIVVLFLLFFPAKKLSKNSTIIKLFIVFLIAVFVGMLSYKLHTEIFPSNHIKYYAEDSAKQVLITGKIARGDPEINEDTGKSYFNIQVNKVNEKEYTGLVRITVLSVLPEESFNYGDIVEIKGNLYKPKPALNPGEFDYRNYLANKKIYALLLLNPNKGDYIEKIESQKGNLFLTTAYKIKHYIIRTIYLTMPDFNNSDSIWKQSLIQGNFLEGILLGNKVLPKEYIDIFRDTGTMHILAVSGFNVSFVTFIFFFILRMFHISKKIAAIINIVFVILFAAITGFTPSVVRASLMAIIVLLAIIIERDTDMFNSIAFSALIIHLISPLDLFDIGFQLSYVATAGLVYLTPFLIEKLKFLPKWLSGSIGISISAQLAIVPLLINYFNRLSIVSILTNILIIPIVGIITVLGFLTFLISFTMPLAKLLGIINWFFITILLKIISFLSSLSFASILVPSVAFISIIIYYIAIIFIKKYSIFSVKWRITIISILIFTLFFNSRGEFIRPGHNENTLKITFLNLKGAYCQYIEFPDNTNMLIGAGGSYFVNQGERTIAPFLLKTKRKITLDNVVVAGTRASDCGGLYYIVSNFRVKNLCVLNYFSKKYNPKIFSKYFTELMELAKERKTPLKIYNEGSIINEYVAVYKNNKKVELLLNYSDKRFYLPSDSKKYLANRDTALEISINR